MPKDRAGDYNQALIEVGALVCVPNGGPKCGECPMATLCLARERGLTGEIPVKAPKKARRIEERTVFLVEADGKVAIRKREGKGLLASLYELPNREGQMSVSQALESLGIPEAFLLEAEELPEAKHIFSHVEWHMRGLRLRLRDLPPWQKGEHLPFFVDKEELAEGYPLPNAFSAYRKLV